MQLKQINQDLKNKLSFFRYQHSLMVAKVAKKLAKRYDYDLKKAYLAGLVHDVAKEFSALENEKWIKIGKLSKKLLKQEFKDIIHADIGAIYIKEVYNLDQDICRAVKYHTIGNCSMDFLAKIIFIADKIGRKNISKELQKIKKLAYKDMNLAVEKYLLYQKGKLESQGKQLHQESIQLLKQLHK